MKTVALAALACAAAFAAHAETEDFDKATPGSLPEGWEGGVTGKGSPRWAVDADSSGPSTARRRGATLSCRHYPRAHGGTAALGAPTSPECGPFTAVTGVRIPVLTTVPVPSPESWG
jgi:hypothetical protein